MDDDRLSNVTVMAGCGAQRSVLIALSAVSNIARGYMHKEVPHEAQKMLSIAVAVALSFPAGNVIIASAQDRDRDQLKTQQQIQDKDKLQTKDQLKEKEQLKEQERTRERTREQTRTERPERPQHEKAERTERGGR